ncbi:hypothetical protein H8N03_01115 [Ramlibacter sp. USB13]|uniref:Metal-dependent hydrolase n=1 Tax=Ramlibacter cellulosilyticus TaxID=2764187 RepID=A0A923MPL3_9BURK|nr:hypothetical protein [Ramlibacter cellulosilyticus]MBC5781522.1 hypothetical protein [Ramlibacter cellulosilyticus]
MFIGHFGIAFAARRLAPRLSLGTAFLAAQWLDLLWPTFLLLGWEIVRIQAGATAVTPLVFEHYPFSHSLVAAVGWSFVLGAAYALLRKDARGAIVVALLVASHWALDAIVHVPDLPLTPGGATRVGLGLWNSMPATLAVELPVFAAGAWLYARSTWTTMDRRGRWGFGALVVFLAVVHAMNLVGPPPPTVSAIAWVGQSQWLLVAWAFWIDTHARAQPGSARVH